MQNLQILHFAEKKLEALTVAEKVVAHLGLPIFPFSSHTSLCFAGPSPATLVLATLGSLYLLPLIYGSGQ